MNDSRRLSLFFRFAPITSLLLVPELLIMVFVVMFSGGFSTESFIERGALFYPLAVEGGSLTVNTSPISNTPQELYTLYMVLFFFFVKLFSFYCGLFVALCYDGVMRWFCEDRNNQTQSDTIYYLSKTVRRGDKVKTVAREPRQAQRTHRKDHKDPPKDSRPTQEKRL